MGRYIRYLSASVVVDARAMAEKVSSKTLKTYYSIRKQATEVATKVGNGIRKVEPVASAAERR